MCPKTCRECKDPYSGPIPTQYYPGDGWVNISVEVTASFCCCFPRPLAVVATQLSWYAWSNIYVITPCASAAQGCNEIRAGTSALALPSQLPLPPHNLDYKQDMYAVRCDWQEVKCNAPRTSRECREKPPDHYVLKISLWMDCSVAFPAHYCTARTQAEIELSYLSRCMHMYRTAGNYDWRASQEALPNKIRGWEPGSIEIEGQYLHSLPLCDQSPDCLAGDAVAPYDYPRCCYIEKWEDLPAYARSMCPTNTAGQPSIARWCTICVLATWVAAMVQ